MVLAAWSVVRIAKRYEARALSVNTPVDTFVHIVDDDPGARESVAALVQSRGVQTREYGSAEEFLAIASEDLCGCLVLDVRMQGMGGLDLQDELRRRDIPLPVIVITGFGDVPVAVRAMQAGAVSFLTKPCQPDDLWKSILQALERCQVEHDVRLRHRAIQQRLSTLTPDEQAVLTKVLLGTPNKLIARDLDIGLRTVELRRSNVMKKMGAESLAELIQMALAVGFTQELSSASPVPLE
jgi:two-component system, LuxR family, response regulator FixJ